MNFIKKILVKQHFSRKGFFRYMYMYIHVHVHKLFNLNCVNYKKNTSLASYMYMINYQLDHSDIINTELIITGYYHVIYKNMMSWVKIIQEVRGITRDFPRDYTTDRYIYCLCVHVLAIMFST